MSDSELNTLPILPCSEPHSSCPTPNEDDGKKSPTQEEMKVELRNRLTGKIIDLEFKKEEMIITEIPQSMLNSLYISDSSIEDDENTNKEIEFVVESENEQEDGEEEEEDDNSTESDGESQSIDEEDTEEEEEEKEDAEEEELDPLDEEDDSKPIIIIVNQYKPETEIPCFIVFMFVIVCGLWLFNNTCKLCIIMDYHKNLA